MVSETWLRNNEDITISNLDCSGQFKTEGQRAGSVAIYQKHNTAHITTPHMNVQYRQTSSCTANSRAIGDIFAAECVMPDGQIVLSVVVYISSNQRVAEIIKFIYSVLLLYTPVRSAELGEDFDKISMMLRSDFNINFATNEAELLLAFLRDKLNLRINTNRNIPTIYSETTIYTVFSRCLDALQSQMYISYLSYHRSIVSCIKEIQNE